MRFVTSASQIGRERQNSRLISEWMLSVGTLFLISFSKMLSNYAIQVVVGGTRLPRHGQTFAWKFMQIVLNLLFEW